MWFYIELTIVMLFGSAAIRIICQKKNISEQIMLSREANYCGIILFFVAALRSSVVGSDTLHYIEYLPYYHRIPWSSFFAGSVNNAQEIGYLLLAKLSTMISLTERFFIVWTSFFSVVPIIWFFKKRSQYPVVSCVLYVLTTMYLFSLGIVRHSLALSVVLIAYDVVLEQKRRWLLKSVLICLFAMLFHSSAIVAIVAIVFFALVKKMNAKAYFISIVITAVLYAASAFIQNIMLWMKASVADSTFLTSGGGWGRLLPSIAVIILLLAYKDRVTSLEDRSVLERESDFWECLAVLGLILKVLSFRITLLTRASGFLTISTLMLLPLIMKKANVLDRFLICFFSILLYGIVFALYFDNQYFYYLLNF